MTTFLSSFIEVPRLIFILLRDSLTKIEFYKKVYSNFTGFGVRYIFVLIFVSTTISSIVIMQKIEPVKAYLSNRLALNNVTLTLDNILKNWEVFSFSSGTIHTDTNETIMINGENGKAIVAVDPEDKIIGTQKKDIPIVFGKSKLIISLGEAVNRGAPISFDYTNIFGADSGNIIIDSEYVLELLKKYVSYYNTALIYLLTPFMVLFNFFTLLAEKIMMIIIVYFALRMFAGEKPSFKSAFRVVMFSSGLSAMLLPLAIFSETLGLIANLSQIWTSFLIISAISSIRKLRQ